MNLIKIYLNLSILIFSLYLFLPIIVQGIDKLGKIITWFIKNLVTLFIWIYTFILSFLWIIITVEIIKNILFFAIKNNFKLDIASINRITHNSIDNMFNKIELNKIGFQILFNNTEIY